MQITNNKAISFGYKNNKFLQPSVRLVIFLCYVSLTGCALDSKPDDCSHESSCELGPANNIQVLELSENEEKPESKDSEENE